MSVLNAVKSKFQAVQDDIRISFNKLSRSESPEKELANASSNPLYVNTNAGSDLLARFQTYWADIHHATEENATVAADVDAQICSLLLFLEHKSIHFQKLNTEISHIPIITSEIQTLTTNMSTLDSAFVQLEDDLLNLENLSEEVDFRKNCNDHNAEFHLWEESKRGDLKRVKVKLSEEHAGKVRTHEQRREEIQREKQAAYNDAFQADIDYFKKYGKLERCSSSGSDVHVDIADIKPDEEDADLTGFLDEEVEKADVLNKDNKDDEFPVVEVKADEDLTQEQRESMKHIVVETSAEPEQAKAAVSCSETESDAK